jgi:hypothetical protein
LKRRRAFPQCGIVCVCVLRVARALRVRVCARARFHTAAHNAYYV